MTRKTRKQFKNAWYHVMNRGAGQRDIFKNNRHRNIFLNLLGDITTKFSIEIHAFCLMDNHYHLLIHTPNANLSECMQYLSCLYTKAHNADV